jgi:FtsP/CotA-like multicopper oxidase with cupredoxin domain
MAPAQFATAQLEEPYSSFASTTAASDPADSVCQRQPAGSHITSPSQLVSSNGVLETTFYFKTVVDEAGLTRYCYISNTGLQAPTLRVNPGDKLIINFVNDISASAAAKPAAMPGMVMKADATAAAATGSCNATSVASTSTNLHFHGLNVSPACGQDEVIHTIIQPQQTFTYTVQIPSNEPAGLYWYHPHPHGFSQGQVLGGATGVIIVEGIQNFNSAVAGLPERVLVIRDQKVTNSGSNAPGNDLSVNYVPVIYPNYVAGIISTPVSTKEFWRIANTSANTLVNLQVIYSGTVQTVQVVAIDGVPLTDGSGNPITSPQSRIVLAAGARVEFIVTTPTPGQDGQLVAQAWNNGADGDPDPARVIARVVASTSTSDGGLPVASIASPIASPIANRASSGITHIPEVSQARPALRFNALNTATAATPTVQRSLIMSVKSDFSQFYITVAGQTPAVFNMDGPPNITVRSGTVEQWTISNQSLMDHAFHIHQIHFRTLAINGTAVNDYTERDTINIPHWTGSGAYPSVTLLMDFTDPDIVGTFVYHCHILSHEDLGMMGSIEVLPPLVASTSTITAAPNPAKVGAAVTFTAEVTGSSGTPTGSVTFLHGTTSLGTVTLNNSGVATLTTSSLPAGTYAITASYSGDTTYAASTSPAVTETVSKMTASSSTITAAPNPAKWRTAVTFTTKVTGSSGTPTGSVTFLHGTTSLGTVPLNGSGTAALSTSTLPVGSYAIHASYSGDTTYAASTSSAVTETITN